MFELPSAKRVRRNDLESPASSRSPSPEASDAATYTNALRDVFSSVEVFTAKPANVATALEHVNKDDEEEQEFEFRLFRSAGPTTRSDGNTEATNDRGRIPSTNGLAVQKLKIRLHSPSPVRGEGGFVFPFRRWEYYFSDPELVTQALRGGSQDDKVRSISSQNIAKDVARKRAKEQFIEAAVSSDEVLAAANHGVWPGCHLPWRVTQLLIPKCKRTTSEISATSTTVLLAATPIPVKSKAKKPGKKRRIILRKRAAMKIAAEEADKDKRNKRNREKKVKRRQKEREKKALAKGGDRGSGSTATVPAAPV